MSAPSADNCEPNMTPLLDLVLQLVMFFMLCANFVMEQTNIDIKLPTAAAAKAIDRGEDKVIFLNVNTEGKVLLAAIDREDDKTTLENPEQVKNFMKRRANVEKKSSGKDKPTATIILRVDKSTPFEKTYAIMKACREAEYSKVQLRAIQDNAG